MEDIEYERMLAAEDGHWWYAGLHDLVLRFARAEHKALGRPMAMLDAGCGTGRLCQLLAPLGEITGCDIHPLALSATRARRGVAQVLHRNLATDALGVDQFDLITVMDVLYHRQLSDEPAALRNLHQVLRSRGMLVLQVPAFECLRGSHDMAVHTRRRYRRKEVVRLLQDAGFDVKLATCRLFGLFPAVLVRRLFSRLAARPAGDGNIPSDLASHPSPCINRWLLAYVKAENRLISYGARFPLGTSIFAVARK